MTTTLTLRRTKDHFLVAGPDIEPMRFKTRPEAKDWCRWHHPRIPIIEIGRDASRRVVEESMGRPPLSIFAFGSRPSKLRAPCPTNSRSASPCVLKIARITWSRGYLKGAPAGRAIGSGTKRWKTTRGSSWSAISAITPPKGAPRISSHANPPPPVPMLVKRMSRPRRVVLLRSKG